MWHAVARTTLPIWLRDKNPANTLVRLSCGLPVSSRVPPLLGVFRAERDVTSSSWLLLFGIRITGVRLVENRTDRSFRTEGCAPERKSNHLFHLPHTRIGVIASSQPLRDKNQVRNTIDIVYKSTKKKNRPPSLCDDLHSYGNTRHKSQPDSHGYRCVVEGGGVT